MLFELGKVVVTRHCLDYANEHRVDLTVLIHRHVVGDDGDLCAADRALNGQAVRDGGRVFSRYAVGSAVFYVITEWDRSYTTVMLAEDY